MQDNNVIMSDFIQYADEEKNINPELTNAYIDFIGEDDLVKLASEVVEVGMPSGYAHTYDPLQFFEDNKALILANLKNIEDLAKVFCCREEDFYSDCEFFAPIVRILVEASKLYGKNLDIIKKEKKIADFDDITHAAIRLLVKETADGWERTKQAESLSSSAFHAEGLF